MKEVDPVGSAVQLEAMSVKVNEIITKWETENPLPEGWFNKIKTKVKVSYAKITRFLIDSLDELILIVEGLVDLGPDKKATVLVAIAAIYDAIVAKSLPVWAKPLNPVIRQFVIMVMVSSAIDFIVGKYRNGEWNKPENTVVS